MSAPLALDHPGPRILPRLAARSCTVHLLTLCLKAGQSFDLAVQQAFADAGFSAGYLCLTDAAFDTLAYVIPAPAPGDGRAAWYSETRRLQDATVTTAGLHLGRKDGAGFLHCHGLWHGPDGTIRMGHLLSPESHLSRDVTAKGWAISGARLEVTPDHETGFDLFAPVATEVVTEAEPEMGQKAVLCTLRPNEDPHEVLASLAPHFPKATIHGLGSLVQTLFEEGRIESYATEVLLHDGQLQEDRVDLTVSSVGMDGRHLTGRLLPHGNRICITAELLVIAA